MGLNEFAGYVALALSALATGWLAARYGLRPEPFYLGIAFVAAGLLLSVVFVKETQSHAMLESRLEGPPEDAPSARDVFWRTTVADRNLSAVSQAGFVNNLNDGMIWGLFPVVLAGAQLSLAQIGTLAAIYPGTWGVAQVATGVLSDRVGRKRLIVAGMWLQAAALAVMTMADRFSGFAMGGVLLGLGTAMVYPTLLAAIGDVAAASWRSSAVGIYRLWRDLGYVAGALVAGVTADLLGFREAMWLVTALTFVSGGIAAVRMTETLRLGRASR